MSEGRIESVTRAEAFTTGSSKRRSISSRGNIQFLPSQTFPVMRIDLNNGEITGSDNHFTRKRWKRIDLLKHFPPRRGNYHSPTRWRWCANPLWEDGGWDESGHRKKGIVYIIYHKLSYLSILDYKITIVE